MLSKQYILDEIRRTAAANGKLPLGKAKFLKETGVKESDWGEKYWARWSDALREAGFEPNSWQSAYDDDVLLERLISLIRKLGHFPVKNELRLERQVDSSFPNDKTFARLGGLGHQLAGRVSDYCKGRAGYDDVLLLCADVLVRRKAKLDENIDESAAFGFVYLMKSGRYYKIGRSNAVGRREYELAIQLPEALKTIHRIQTDDPAGIEEYWHKRFAAKRKNGEWFDLDASDIKAFTRRQSFM